MTQPFFTTEQFTGLQGKLVSLNDALDGCEGILADEYQDYPESAFYMTGTLDDVKQKAKAAKPDADKHPMPPLTQQTSPAAAVTAHAS